MSSDFAKAFLEIKVFIAEGGKASQWFAQAYASWYWVTDFWGVNLNGYERLDSGNKRLFVKMLNLRELDGWTDSELHNVALFAVEHWNLLPPKRDGA
ncbi:hypothetical protein [Pseudomonas phoenicis]|uniref:hypothetical protein n=1 Tax=unclassified Pseudomonas TaxID=196821 RepID=UPI0039A0E676